jgi:D-Tyr-tRNAtyr deacylase
VEFTDRRFARGLVVKAGRFGAHMAVSSVNDGPGTQILDTGGPEG